MGLRQREFILSWKQLLKSITSYMEILSFCTMILFTSVKSATYLKLETFTGIKSRMQIKTRSLRFTVLTRTDLMISLKLTQTLRMFLRSELSADSTTTGN